MSLFRDESPMLGAQTSEAEVGASSTSLVTLVQSYYKPTTREIIAVPLIAAAGANSQYAFIAPWACKVVGIRFNGTVVSSGASALSVVKITADGVAPQADNGTTVRLLTASTFALSTFTPNTKVSVALTATSSLLNLNAGDEIALFAAAATTGLAGAIVQIEVVQVG